ncbi:transcriptional repressor AgaR [Xenorhabdus lircayensis]|uniref:DeoR family transcriptional regulator n=1 Tax=Xenorhabdus lircayensis TaxID=2763499 RepID=A0ABS0U2Y9_9GAMM|nr:transcriptional repressor AgaR [Xenorhabdus lircayensis]MBI6548263.1 DeoR family transcriptional regulator [Xenorhabdus lircayensis]
MSTETAKRRQAIIDLLCDVGSVRVEALSQHFGVSSVTIRSDLRYLEKEGCVIRAYGGARVNNKFVFDRPLRVKGRIEEDIKSRIGARAAEFIQDGDSLIIDSGSTTAEIVPYLAKYRSLTVMTNALNIAYQLTGFDDTEVIVLGGIVRKNSYSLYGVAAEQQLSQYRFNTVFLGVDGFDLEAGITTSHAGEAHLNRIMCNVAQQIIAVTDGSKFGRRSFCLIREAHQIHRLITDRRIPEHYRTTLIEQGVDVIIVD